MLDRADVAPQPAARCCHLVNLMVWSQSHSLSVLTVSWNLAVIFLTIMITNI